VPTTIEMGLVYYYAGRDTEARDVFDGLLSGGAAVASIGQRAHAQYYLAVIDERTGATSRAIEGYGRVPAIDPTSSFADDALWWKGRLEERAGRDKDARASYEDLAAAYSGRDWGEEARFRLALLDYDAGEFADAAAASKDIAASTKSTERQRALLWQGKALDASGDEKAAAVLWQELRNAAPDAYYGLRAAVLLGDADGRLRTITVGKQSEPDWEAVDAWLEKAAGRPSAPPQPAIESDTHWRLGEELLTLGMQRRADNELGIVLEEAGRDPLALAQVARAAYESGQTHLSSRAATRLLDAVPDHVAAEAPGDLWRLAYPAPFGELLETAAEESDTPDLLMLALVRQESFFDALAGSTAGALGLTQVVPQTGESIADDRDVAGFETAELFRPVVSLTFGAHYLGQQLDTFDGDIYAALAAYNAGPVAAARWRRASGDDADRFYAEIEFSQTKAYVRLVSENLARYRQLYQGSDEPELPRDP